MEQGNGWRRFTVSNEVDIVADVDIEYRGGGWWRATVDTSSPDDESVPFRSVYDAERWAAGEMERIAQHTRDTCGCGTDGEDTSGNGNFACGVLSPHGVHVTVWDADGNDMTQDYWNNS